MTDYGPLEQANRIMWLDSALAGVTIDTLPAFIEANPNLSEHELDVIRGHMMEWLAQSFPVVFNGDSMKRYYEQVQTSSEVNESMQRVFDKLGIKPI